MGNVAVEIRTFIESNLVKGRTVGYDTPLFENGLIDSFALIELVFFLKETYKINIDEYCIMNDNIDTINKIADFIEISR